MAIALALAALGVSQAHALLTISSKPTKHVTCTGGVCSSGNSRTANLNVTDLADMLAGSDISVVSDPGTEDIEIDNALSWVSASRLTLDSWRAITFKAALTVAGPGGLTLTTNRGEPGYGLRFAGASNAAFWDTSSSLVINGTPYTLVADVVTLASGLNNDPAGNFALANTYDAAADGLYTRDPVTATVRGNIEGLGNSILNLRIDTRGYRFYTGLIYGTISGTISDLHLVNEDVKGGRKSQVGGLAGFCGGSVVNSDVSGSVSSGPNSLIGGLCGTLTGSLIGDSSSGTVQGIGNFDLGQTYAGGLVGKAFNSGSIFNSSSAASVSGGKRWTVGGLAGLNRGTIASSFATGTVTATDLGVAGGLIGNNFGPNASVTNSYASGAVTDRSSGTVGGFIGLNAAPVGDSYSSGAVTGTSVNAVGGFIGSDSGTNDLTDTYWDTTTSGQSQGVGNDASHPGVAGLTTAQFQAALPAGFDPSFWTERAGVNGGLPYLLENLPK